jgi:protease-4
VILLSVLGMLVLFASFRLHQPSVAASTSTVLVFDVPSDLEEAEPAFPRVSLAWLHRNRIALYTLVHGLDQAARDDRVTALVLHIGDMDWGWAKIAEVRDAVLRFRSSGKPVYASLGGGGEAEYLLASAADQVAIPPAAWLQLNGLTASAVFLRGSLDKLGIRPNYAHAGRFKSAVESYTRTGMSPESRRALEALLDDSYRLLADSLAAAREMPADSVRRLLDRGPFGAGAALARGLVDTLLYEADIDSLALREAGRGAVTLSLARYAGRLPTPRAGPHIALVTASGTIVPGRSRYVRGEGQALGAETLIEALRQARNRRSVKAVVLRIDSPGGVLEASDDIWGEVRRCRAVKPVIVSMSDYAASGAYYIAVGADRIVAQPSTVTGSIGVYGGKLNLLGLYRKLGLNVETVSRGAHAEMMSPFRDFTAEEAGHFQRQLDEAYEIFLARVAEGRHLSRATADSLGQGRVWSGIEARARGLVDTLGGFETVFPIALEKAGFARDESFIVDRFPRVEHPILERLLQDWLEGGDSVSEESALSPVFRAWLAAARFQAGTALALMPYSIEIR